MKEIKKRTKAVDTKKQDVKEKDENKAIYQNKAAPCSDLGNISLKVLSRVVMIFSLLIIVYFSTKDDKLKIFAKQSEILAGKGLVVECSLDYKKELDQFEGCFPKECKRFVTDTVISASEAEELLAIAKKGLKFGGSAGGASILDLHSGALTMGKHFINIYKKENAKNLFTQQDFNTYRVVKEKIKYALAHHFEVDPNKIFLTFPTFFSKLTSKPAVTIHDEYWHPHVDKETYQSFHYTSLLYLGDYNIDFTGGRFIFVDERFNKSVEPRKGRLSMFTSGGENLHYVEKVDSGTRYAITVSFTCDKQHGIEDPNVNKYEEK